MKSFFAAFSLWLISTAAALQNTISSQPVDLTSIDPGCFAQQYDVFLYTDVFTSIMAIPTEDLSCPSLFFFQTGSSKDATETTYSQALSKVPNSYDYKESFTLSTLVDAYQSSTTPQVVFTMKCYLNMLSTSEEVNYQIERLVSDGRSADLFRRNYSNRLGMLSKEDLQSDYLVVTAVVWYSMLNFHCPA